MGNRGSTGRRRNNSMNHHHHEPPPPQPHPQPSQPPEAAGNRYVFAAATPYPPPQYPPPNLLPSPLQHQPPPPPYYQYGMGNYNPPPPSAAPMPLPVPFDLHHRIAGPHAYPYGHMPPPPPSAPMPYVEHQKAVTIRNDVNLKKESLRMVPDEVNPGMFLVAFTFDATTAGCISVLFFAKEGFDCNLTPAKEGLLDSVTIPFNEGLGQKFHQPSGTGISFSMFEEAELTKEGGMEVYPLAVKAEAFPVVPVGLGDDSEDQKTGTPNSQITQAVFVKKENGEYGVRVVKQILWVNETRYELQEIYGIGNSVDGDDLDGSDPGKECVICLSEPRDTTVLPCRHMCMCSDCAKVLRFQTNRCPICRQPVERLLEIKVNNSNNNSSNGSGNRGEEQLQQQEA